jgi:hypothetical protein
MLHQLIRWFAYGKQDPLFVKIVLVSLLEGSFLFHD